ncbi:MAG: hypothetical protein ACHP7P_16595 [Terriglobales bacterium]
MVLVDRLDGVGGPLAVVGTLRIDSRLNVTGSCPYRSSRWQTALDSLIEHQPLIERFIFS